MSTMLSSFIGKLRHSSQESSVTTTTCPGWVSQSRPDEEEDGFLLVGQTASERSTILPTQIAQGSGNWRDVPPSYESQVQHTADYGSNRQSVPDGHWSSLIHSPTPTTCSNPSTSADESDGGRQNSSYAALMMAEVPFRLSEGLDCAQKLTSDMSYFAVPRLQNYDPSKYVYDFEHERRVIQEAANFGE